MKQYLLVKNKERDKKIIEFYNCGLNQKEIGIIIGLKQPGVSYILRKNKVKSHYIKNGKNNPNWRGGIRYDDKRKLIYSPNHPYPDYGKVYCYEYKLIIEKHLGRFLKKGEIVHHINGDRTDNRIENLQVMTQGEHINLHKKQGDMKLK
jgi:hypothetical protein